METALSCLTFREVTDEARIDLFCARTGLADMKINRKSSGAASSRSGDQPNPDNLSLPGSEIAFQVLVVALTVGRRHQRTDVLAEQLRLALSEHALCRSAGRQDEPALIDYDHGIGNGLEDRGEMSLKRKDRRLICLTIGCTLCNHWACLAPFGAL